MKKVFFLILFFLTVSTVTVLPQSIPEGYAAAMNAFNQGNYSRSYELFSQFYDSRGIDDDLSSTAKYYAAESLLRLDRVDAAIAAYEFFTSRFVLSNYRDEALYKLGILYYGKKEYANAREKLQLLLEDYPTSQYAGTSHYFIGDSYVKEGNLKDAVSFFEDAISTKKNNKYIDNSIYSLANIYEKTGDYNKAVAYYDSLLAYYKTSSLAPHAQVRIGLCYFELKNYDNAVIELNDPLITQLPAKQQTEAKYVLANSYYRLKEYRDAEQTFSSILKDNPKTPLARHVRYGLAWVNFQKGNYDESYKIFSSLSRSGDDSISVNSLFWSAESKRYAGKEKDAEIIYDEFLSSYPESYLASRVKYQMGVVNYTENKSAVSEDFLLQSAESRDLSVKSRAYTLLGELRLNKKDYLKAKDYFQSVLDMENVSKDLYDRATLGTGAADYYLNQYDEAMKKLSELNSSNPQFEPEKVHFYMAECWFAKKEYSKALKEYNLAGTENPDIAPQAVYGKAYAYYNLKNFNEASYYFADYVKRYFDKPNVKDAKLRLADSYYGEKKFNEAGRIYKQVFLSDTTQLGSDYAYYQYAQALYKAGNSGEAIREFNNLQERFPDSKYVDESQYVIGWIYFQRGNFRESIANYYKLIERYPNSSVVPVAYNSIGNAYFNLGRYDSSIANYRHVLEVFPQTSYVYDAISGIKDAYIVSGRPDKAVEVIDEFAARNYGSGFADQVLFKKGEIYYSERNYEKAKESYKEFIAAYPKSSLAPEAYYWIGKSASNLGQNEEALYNFNIVFKQSLNTETGIASVLEMGRIHTDLKNYDNAIFVYSTAIDQLPPESPKVAEIMYNRAMVYVDKGEFNKAYEDFNYLVQYYPNSIFTANAKYEAALLALARKDYENCDLLLKELSEGRTDDLGAKAQYYYGVSLFEQNKLDDAITALVRVKFAFPGYDEWLTNSYMKLGEIYEKKGDNAKARDMYRAVLSHHRGDNYGAEAQKKLQVLE
ncbi:MAG: tetratricopeptide repeat protein [Bacillota bacterium]